MSPRLTSYAASDAEKTQGRLFQGKFVPNGIGRRSAVPSRMTRYKTWAGGAYAGSGKSFNVLLSNSLAFRFPFTSSLLLFRTKSFISLV
ncbi:hypothetical protein VI817_007911 [Penicillium citrinum]|nr:hypothetical protein VI817_007911 [Penicillium citrinum]